MWSSPMPPQQPSKQTATTPLHKTKKTKSALILGGKNYHRHSGIFISRKRKENIRNLRRKAGMTSHWRECEAPLRRTQRDGANETILCRSQAPLGNASREALLRIPAPAIAPGTNTAPPQGGLAFPSESRGGFFHTLSRGQAPVPATALRTNGNNTPTIVISAARRACARFFRRAPGSSPGPDSSPESAPSFWPRTLSKRAGRG